MTRTTHALPGGLTFVLEPTRDFPPPLQKQAIALTAMVFPGEASLEGKFYYDSEPAQVAYALDGDTLVALRPLDRRKIEVAGHTLDIAGGIIPTVHPDYRRRGIASAMAEVLLQAFTGQNIDYSLAFLFDGAPEWFLSPLDYKKLENTFFYTDNTTGEEREETARAYGRAIRTLEPDVEAVFASKDRLHIGRGIF